MQVNVELKASATREGWRSILEQWETQFPMGELYGVNSYDTICLTLKMPPATQVVPPQLVDLTAEKID